MEIQFDAEAFGAANTKSRPWMQGTVWIIEGARDLPVLLAHELFHVFTNSGEQQYYRIEVPDARTLHVSLDSSADTGTNEKVVISDADKAHDVLNTLSTAIAGASCGSAPRPTGSKPSAGRGRRTTSAP